MRREKKRHAAKHQLFHQTDGSTYAHHTHTQSSSAYFKHHPLQSIFVYWAFRIVRQLFHGIATDVVFVALLFGAVFATRVKPRWNTGRHIAEKGILLLIGREGCIRRDGYRMEGRWLIVQPIPKRLALWELGAKNQYAGRNSAKGTT